MKTLVLFLIAGLLLVTSCQKDDTVIVPNDYTVQVTVKAYGDSPFIFGWRTSDMEDGYWNKWLEEDSLTLVVALGVMDTLEVGSYGNRIVAYFGEVLYVDTTFSEYLRLRLPME